jgi:predicted NUDIX family NTP pyrophosphohydrolase
MKVSAGTLLYRSSSGALEVLLVHPSGNYNKDKPYSIPKGLAEPGETLEEAARRETREETGLVVSGPVVDLGSIKYQKSGKQVHCFASAAADLTAPRPASWEVDDARFMPLAEASTLIHPDQRPFLERLEQMLRSQSPA